MSETELKQAILQLRVPKLPAHHLEAYAAKCLQVAYGNDKPELKVVK